MSLFKQNDAVHLHRDECPANGVRQNRLVGGGAAKTTVDQSSIRGLVTAGALFVAAFL
jgi:hypothetical protein